ncbi:hypothetical protein SNOG_05454 [Parastagonospora nodorum SN15]|uniref:Uncharacterized protein n=1 Tax=Phaeosphaeria nodorum (strain SN15 / ATCC MYA-4574 / FGSC 10173) TaxID=321614 RepID=Q0US10_PHANO|nr:hypothetical protein SNOG_05454 [Parastagonospora nodorum SN15]EAT87845.1 hypothetical protein SNOG_05454 [Parastagonospora nodorum SN15]
MPVSCLKADHAYGNATEYRFLKNQKTNVTSE